MVLDGSWENRSNIYYKVYLYIVHHAYFNEIHMWNMKCYRRVSAIPLKEWVDIIYCKCLQPWWGFVCLHTRVAQHIWEANLLGLNQVFQLILYIRILITLALRWSKGYMSLAYNIGQSNFRRCLQNKSPN